MTLGAAVARALHSLRCQRQQLRSEGAVAPKASRACLTEAGAAVPARGFPPQETLIREQRQGQMQVRRAPVGEPLTPAAAAVEGWVHLPPLKDPERSRGLTVLAQGREYYRRPLRPHSVRAP